MKQKLIIILSIIALAWTGINAQSRVVEFDNPKLKVFLPPKNLSNGKAIVGCPGGGYQMIAVDHEGYDWAPYFNNLGYAYAVLTYTLPAGDKTLPMNDVDAAFKILNDNAQEWNINPDSIGIMGSSAGGHLAATISTHPMQYARPAFQILWYPVISLEESITHQGTRRGFLGENPTAEEVSQWSAHNAVTSTTPPAFIALSADDKVVLPINSWNYFNALVENKVPVAMFIYPTGGHGWGYRNKFIYHDQVIRELTTWLSTL